MAAAGSSPAASFEFRLPKGRRLYIQKITFRRWAKLWTLGNVQCHSLSSADLRERQHPRLDLRHARFRSRGRSGIGFCTRLPISGGSSWPSASNRGQSPDYLVCEVYNPTDRPVSLTMSFANGRRALRPSKAYRCRSRVSRVRKISVADIKTIVAVEGVIEVELVPNDAKG